MSGTSTKGRVRVGRRAPSLRSELPLARATVRQIRHRRHKLCFLPLGCPGSGRGFPQLPFWIALWRNVHCVFPLGCYTAHSTSPALHMPKCSEALSFPEVFSESNHSSEGKQTLGATMSSLCTYKKRLIHTKRTASVTLLKSPPMVRKQIFLKATA